MPTIFFLVFIAMVIILVVGGIFAHRKQQERQDALTRLANQLGWQFDPTRNYDHQDEFHQFSAFTVGQRRYAYNTLRGTLMIDVVPCPAQMGDYHYETTSGTGKNRRTTTHLFSYLIVETPYNSTHELKIRREQFFDRVASFIGFDDIDFESNEFSDRFHVKSSSKRFAYDVIHPRMMEFLMTEDPPTIHLAGRHCCIHVPNHCWSPEEFDRRVNWLREFFQLWPRHMTSTFSS